MRVCLSPGGPTTNEGSGPAEDVLVGTLDGLHILRRSASGTGWEVARRALDGHHVSAVLVEPSRGTIFAATHGQGVFASEDGGQTWQPRNGGLDQPNVYCLSRVVTPRGTRLYLGTEPAHLFVSEDLGQTWRELRSLAEQPTRERWMFPAAPHVAHLKHVTFDPRDPDTIFAGVEVGGLYKSTDQGETWEELGGVYLDVHRVVIRPSEPDRMYVTGGNGIYETPDGGRTWEQLTTRTARFGYPDALVMHPDNHDLLFTAGAFASPRHWGEAKTADPCIARSLDGGRTWDVLREGLPEHIHGNIEALSLHRHADGFSLYAATTDGDVFASEDEGNRWALIAGGLPAVSKGGHYRFDAMPPREEAMAAAGR